jgi:hypothetical protein
MIKLPFSQLTLALCVAAALLWWGVRPGSALTNDVITITGADGTRNILPVSSATLQTFLSNVIARPAVQFGEGMRYIALTNAPAPLQTLLTGVPARVQIQNAESNRILAALTYPDALVDDSQPPQVSAITPVPTGNGSVATITWTTNEFTDSMVRYGTQAGNLSQTVSNPLYAKNHAITLSGLTPGATYYFKVVSTDRSGNSIESAESSFDAVATQYIYLPMIVR